MILWLYTVQWRTYYAFPHAEVNHITDKHWSNPSHKNSCIFPVSAPLDSCEFLSSAEIKNALRVLTENLKIFWIREIPVNLWNHVDGHNSRKYLWCFMKWWAKVAIKCVCVTDGRVKNVNHLFSREKVWTIV